MAAPIIPPEYNDLTQKQRDYAFNKVLGGMTQSDAYRASYDAKNMNPFDVGTEALRLNNHPRIAALIYYLQNEQAKSHVITKDWLIRWHWARAVYDANELTRVIVGACEYCHGENHLRQWRAPEYLEATCRAELAEKELPDIAGGFGYDHRRAPHPDCPVCDGGGRHHTWFADTSELSESARAAFEGVEQTRDGIRVRMADRDKNMERVAKLMGLEVATLNLVADIPSAEDRAAMPPDRIAAEYKRIMQGG